MSKNKMYVSGATQSQIVTPAKPVFDQIFFTTYTGSTIFNVLEEIPSSIIHHVEFMLIKMDTAAAVSYMYNEQVPTKQNKIYNFLATAEQPKDVLGFSQKLKENLISKLEAFYDHNIVGTEVYNKYTEIFIEAYKASL